MLNASQSILCYHIFYCRHASQAGTLLTVFCIYSSMHLNYFLTILLQLTIYSFYLYLSAPFSLKNPSWFSGTPKWEQNLALVCLKHCNSFENTHINQLWLWIRHPQKKRVGFCCGLFSFPCNTSLSLFLCSKGCDRRQENCVVGVFQGEDTSMGRLIRRYIFYFFPFIMFLTHDIFLSPLFPESCSGGQCHDQGHDSDGSRGRFLMAGDAQLQQLTTWRLASCAVLNYISKYGWRARIRALVWQIKTCDGAIAHLWK